MPVLAAALGVHDLRHRAANSVATQETVLAASERINLIAVRERKLVRREQMIVVLPVVPSRRREPMIEEPQSRSRNVRHDCIEHLPIALVGLSRRVELYALATILFGALLGTIPAFRAYRNSLIDGLNTP